MSTEKRPWTGDRLRFCALLALLLGLPVALKGQERPPAESLSLAEAVRLTLEHDLNLRLQEARLRSAHGILLSTRGSFDPVLSSSMTETETNLPVSATASESRAVTGNTFGITKRFRNGLSIEPELELLRTDTSGIGADNVGKLSFTFRQPLLRGRGWTATAAPERSAERQVVAGELDVRQVTSERVLAVGAQYWLARAAALNLGILRENEERARELLETTRKLIEADVTPAAELVQVEANLVSTEVARIGGERALFEARQALGREIGLERAAIAALPIPSDPFPGVPPSTLPKPEDTDRFVTGALRRRSDLLAARERRDASEILRRAADNGLRPQLDLVLTPSYTGLVEGTDPGSFFSPLLPQRPGRELAAFSLSLSWPTQNSRARGELAQIEAAREQSVLLEDLLARQIGADVPTALDAVGRSAQQLDRADACRAALRAGVGERGEEAAGRHLDADRRDLAARPPDGRPPGAGLAPSSGPRPGAAGSPLRDRVRSCRRGRPGRGSLPVLLTTVPFQEGGAVIFRKVALERLSSPEQLDQLLQVTSPRGWLALGAFGALLLTALGWAVLGSIPTEATGEGILLRQGGVSSLVAAEAGQVEELLVSVGDVIEKGQGVARIRQEELLRQIQDTRDKLAGVRSEYRDLLRYAGEQERLRDRDLAQQGPIWSRPSAPWSARWSWPATAWRPSAISSRTA